MALPPKAKLETHRKRENLQINSSVLNNFKASTFRYVISIFILTRIIWNLWVVKLISKLWFESLIRNGTKWFSTVKSFWTEQFNLPTFRYDGLHFDSYDLKLESWRTITCRKLSVWPKLVIESLNFQLPTPIFSSAKFLINNMFKLSTFNCQLWEKNETFFQLSKVLL